MDVHEKTLLISAQQGNDYCFEEIYKLYYSKVYALALATVKNSADAEDILQTVFIKAWQNLGRLRDITAFNTWIQRITLNECYTLLQTRGRGGEVSLNDEVTEIEVSVPENEEEFNIPEIYAERVDLSERLKEIIDGLSLVQRQSVMLYYYCELTVPEIAQTMGCSEGTVKSRLYLARNSIRGSIKNYEKKTGSRFYGIAGIPMLSFGDIFKGQVMRRSISGAQAKTCFINIYTAHSAAAAAAAPVGIAAAGAGAAGMALSTKVLLGVLAGLLVVCGVTAAVTVPMLLNKNSGAKKTETTHQIETTVNPSSAPQTTETPTTVEPTTAEPTTEEPTTEEPTTEPDIRQDVYDAYVAVLNENVSSFDVTGYYTHDIDGDGITELIVDIGTAQLARKCVAYTYDKDSGNTVNAGDLYVSDGGIILTSDGNLVTTAGRSGYYSYNKISMFNQKIVSTGMFDDHDLHDIDGEYLRAIPTSNLEPLKNAVFN